MMLPIPLRKCQLGCDINRNVSILHEESGESHEMGNVGVVLAQLHVSGDVEAQQASESTDNGETNSRD